MERRSDGLRVHQNPQLLPTPLRRVDVPTRETRIAVNMSCVAGLMLAGAFLSWGSVPGRSAVSELGLGNALSLLAGDLQIPISGWVGALTVAGLELVNWLPLLAVLSAVAMAWLRAGRVTRVPYPVIAVVLLLAVAHLVGVFLQIRGIESARMGFGWFVSLFAVVLSLVALAPQESVESKTAGVE